MSAKNLLGAAVAAAILLSAPLAWAEAPPVGVYGCFDPHMKYNPVRNSFDLEILATPFVMFGLIDGSTYSDWDGHHGHYTYDAGTQVITMTDGSRQGWRYKKVGDKWGFSLIDNKTNKLIYQCPFEANKNPAHGPW